MTPPSTPTKLRWKTIIPTRTSVSFRFQTQKNCRGADRGARAARCPEHGDGLRHARQDRPGRRTGRRARRRAARSVSRRRWNCSACCRNLDAASPVTTRALRDFFKRGGVLDRHASAVRWFQNPYNERSAAGAEDPPGGLVLHARFTPPGTSGSRYHNRADALPPVGGAGWNARTGERLPTLSPPLAGAAHVPHEAVGLVRVGRADWPNGVGAHVRRKGVEPGTSWAAIGRGGRAVRLPWHAKQGVAGARPRRAAPEVCQASPSRRCRSSRPTWQAVHRVVVLAAQYARRSGMTLPVPRSRRAVRGHCHGLDAGGVEGAGASQQVASGPCWWCWRSRTASSRPLFQGDHARVLETPVVPLAEDRVVRGVGRREAEATLATPPAMPPAVSVPV